MDYSKESDEAILYLAQETLNSLSLPKEAKEQVASKLLTRDDQLKFLQMHFSQKSMAQQKQTVNIIENIQTHIQNNSIPGLKQLQELFEHIKSSAEFEQQYLNQNGLNDLFILLQRLQKCIRVHLPSFHQYCSDERQVNIKNWHFKKFEDLKQEQIINSQNFEEISNLQTCIFKCLQIIRSLCDKESEIKKIFRIKDSFYMFLTLFYESWSQEIREEAIYIITTMCLLPHQYFSLDYVIQGLDTYAFKSNTNRFQCLFDMASYYTLSLTNYNLNSFLSTIHEFNIMCYLLIIIMCFRSDKYNPTIQSRIIIRQQFKECNYNDLINLVQKFILSFMSQLLIRDSSEVAYDLKQYVSEAIQLDSLDVILLQEISNYFSSDDCELYDVLNSQDSTGNIKYLEKIVDQFSNLLTNLYNLLQSDLWDTQSINFNSDNYEQFKEDLPIPSVRQICQQISEVTTKLPQFLQSYINSALNNINLLVSNFNSQNTDQMLIYFQSIYNFSKRMVQDMNQFNQEKFSSEIAERAKILVQSFSHDYYDQLLKDKYEKDFKQQVQVVEYLFGCPISDLVKTHKNVVNYQKEFQDSFHPKGCLRAISQDLFEQCSRFELVLKEKDQIIKKLQQQTRTSIHGQQYNADQSDSKGYQMSSQPLQSVSQLPIAIPTAIPAITPNIPGQTSEKPLETSIPSNSQKLPSSGIPLPPSSGLLPTALPVLPSGLPSSLPVNTPSGLPLPPSSLPSGLPQPSGLPSGLPQPSGLPSLSALPKPPSILQPNQAQQEKSRQIINKIPVDKKLKPFFWDKLKKMDINQADFWKNMGDVDFMLSQDTIKTIMEQFSDLKATVSSSVTSTIKDDNKLISLIDPKRSQQIGIMLQKLRLTPQEIKNHILELQDISVLDPGINTLLSACPFEEDFELLRNNLKTEPQIARYMRPEQYVIEMQDVPNLHLRLKNWALMRGFEQLLAEFQPVFCVTRRFFDFIAGAGFQQLFHVLLSFGNLVNANTPRSDGYGFKLKTLSKFFDFKDSGNKQNIMAHVIKFCEKLDQGLPENQELEQFALQLKEDVLFDGPTVTVEGHILKQLELFNIVVTRFKRQNFEEEGVEFDRFYSSVMSLKDTVGSIQTQIPNDAYGNYVGSFLARSLSKLEEMKEKQRICQQQFESAKQQFVEQPKVKFGDFCAYFVEMSDLFQAQVQQMKAQEAEIEKQEAKKQASKRVKVKKERENEQIQMSVDCTSLMDNLMNNFVENNKKKIKR